MPHPTVWYEVDEKNFEKRLRKLVKRGKNLSPAFQEIGNMFRQSRKTIFALKGPGGYPDLSPKYKKQKGKPKKRGGAGFVYPILKRTGKLEKSITRISDGNNITIIRPKAFAFGTNLPYAKYHNSGRTPRRKIPLRKFVFWGPEAPRTMRNLTSKTKNFHERAIRVIARFIAREKKDGIK